MKIQQGLAGVILILLLVGAVLGVRYFRTQSGKQAEKSAVPVGEALKAKGPEDSKITVVEYSDFQCPACQAGVPIIKELVGKYPDKFRVIYRHFPLQSHLWSPLAHQSAECAHAQGKFWEYHDLVFQNQKIWSGPANPAEKFLEYAKTLNLNLDRFSACLSDPKTAEKVQADKKHGEAMQVQSTPTFFVNGDRLVGPAELKFKGENLIRTALGLAPIPAPEKPAAPQTPLVPLIQSHEGHDHGPVSQNTAPASSSAPAAEMSRA